MAKLARVGLDLDFLFDLDVLFDVLFSDDKFDRLGLGLTHFPLGWPQQWRAGAASLFGTRQKARRQEDVRSCERRGRAVGVPEDYPLA